MDLLAEALEVLASPVRLRILKQLRRPKTLHEIEVPPGVQESSPGRNIARQTVTKHLKRLVEIRAVSVRRVRRDQGETAEYTINHQRLFALSEEFRALARLRPGAEPTDPTQEALRQSPDFVIKGPCLVLVKGLDEGRTFSLDSSTRTAREWLIGRRRGLAVSLDFDPFVSSEHARLHLSASAYSVEGLPESRNGTQLNFELLQPGKPHQLATGDLIGVGKSILMFRQ
jgi:DNA-binding transcriptional ArsR family regulator